MLTCSICLQIRTILHWIRSQSTLLFLISRSVPFQIFNVLKCAKNPMALGRKLGRKIHNKNNCVCKVLQIQELENKKWY